MNNNGTGRPPGRAADGRGRFFGAPAVGERGQVVLPADARRFFGIGPGDRLLVVGAPDHAGLLLLKIRVLEDDHARDS